MQRVGWLDNAMAVTRAVWLDVLQGVENNQEQGRATTLLNDFELIELTVSDFDWATRQLLRLRLSHNVDAFDCLIAAPSYRLQLPLYTRNMKHFAPMLGKLAIKPY
jgi:predicted nucleic acid-binding protein